MSNVSFAASPQGYRLTFRVGRRKMGCGQEEQTKGSSKKSSFPRGQTTKRGGVKDWTTKKKELF